MRSVIWVILLFVAAVVAAAALSQNDGLVSIFYSGYRVDTSLNVFVISVVVFVVVLYIALKAVNGLVSMPRGVGAFLSMFIVRPRRIRWRAPAEVQRYLAGYVGRGLICETGCFV